MISNILVTSQVQKELDNLGSNIYLIQEQILVIQNSIMDAGKKQKHLSRLNLFLGFVTDRYNFIIFHEQQKVGIAK